MTLNEFNNVVMEQMGRCKSLLFSKGEEYVPDAYKQEEKDRLAMFKKAAVLTDTTPKVALLGMLTKHLVSVSDMCVFNQEYSLDRWNEKITDSINYLLILRALVEEEAHEEN